MIRQFLVSFLAAIVMLGLASPGGAEEQAGTPPVAVISLAWGVVTVKHQDADYKPARWLEPIFPGDQVRTSGAGSKLLITYFFDNHQEVMGPDAVATAQATTLSKVSGATAIRKDAARQPFGAGGVESPYIYTHQLVESDFAGADAPQAIEGERATLASRVRPAFPPSFSWKDNGSSVYTLSLQQVGLTTVAWSKTVSGTQYRLTTAEANQLLKGVNYTWKVVGDDDVVVRSYQFKLLTLPLKKWYDEQVGAFDKSRNLAKLQRSEWTDYLLVCAQVLEIDRTMEILEKMRQMDPANPRVLRALTRVYLMKGCPAHAKAAYDQQITLGGRDPIYP